MQEISGIYKIQNNYNQKLYIGQSKVIFKRWQQHKSDLNNRYHHCKKLQTDWAYYGEDAFSFHILEETPIHLLRNAEQNYIERYPKERLYNYDIAAHPWKVNYDTVFKPLFKIDCDGVALPLKYCPNCGYEKLANSFVAESLYCLDCRTAIDMELIQEDETLDGFRMPSY